MASAPPDIPNQVLLELGAKPLDDWPADLASATDNNQRLAVSTYERIVSDLLMSHPWNFTRERLRPPMLPLSDKASKEYGFAYEHQLPEARMLTSNLIAVYANEGDKESAAEGWQVVGDKIYSDFRTPVIAYQTRTPEAEWPDDFTSYVINTFCYKWAFAITNQAKMVEFYKMEAKDARETAISNDARNNPQEGFSDFSIDQIRQA